MNANRYAAFRGTENGQGQVDATPRKERRLLRASNRMKVTIVWTFFLQPIVSNVLSANLVLQHSYAR
jgi:hypothetical protein